MRWPFAPPSSDHGGFIRRWRRIWHATTRASCRRQEGEAILNRAATKAIQEQRDLGFDEWTGGEYHTDNFILHMHKCLTGLEIDKPQAEDVFDYDDMTHAKIVGKITAPNGLGYLEAFRREKKLPGRRAQGGRRRALRGGRGRPRSVSMRSRRRCRQLQKSSTRSCAPWPTKAARTCSSTRRSSAAEVNMGMMTAQQAADLIAPCFEGVKATRSLHFCNGNLRGRPISHALHCAPWVDILERLDGVVDVAAFEVKYFFQWIERDVVQANAEEHAARGRHR